MPVGKRDLRQRSVRRKRAGIGMSVEVAEGNSAVEEEEVPAADARRELARVVAAGCGFVHRAFLVVLVHHVLGFLLRAAVAAAGIEEPGCFLSEWC